ncbi:MAG: hypothetical protein KGP14_10240, partial [Betaproteobacteria bacterium]|nr:hypothetical protein [Betaproteobacteria bacterium]
PHIMRNVKISGKYSRPYAFDAQINTPTAFSEVGRLYVDPAFFPNIIQSSYIYTFRQWLINNPLNSWMVHMGGTRWARNIIGNLETQPLKWSMKDTAGSVASVKVTLNITQDDTKTVGSGGISTLLREYAVFGSTQGNGGYFSYLSAAQLSTGAVGGYAPTITFSGAGSDEYLVCTLSFANGVTPANGRAVGIVEFI